MPLSDPKFLGRYELGPELGSGGSSVVYLARGRGTDADRTTVAIKVLHTHMRETATQDLLQEARLAGSIEHPNVVRVLEVSDEASAAYLVMEYVDGETLSSLMRHRLSDARLATGVALRVLLDALEGLQAAHELRGDKGDWLGLVHRDFTPQNVLVGRDGRAKLSDFGTAKAANAIQRTRTGQVKGKVAYMAPEQVRGLALDRRCDLWAAGVMAWEILAGRPLHLDPDEVQVMFKVVTEAPPPLRQVQPELPASLEQVVTRALCLKPDERWASATELREALLSAWTAAYGPLPGVDEVARAVAFAREQRPVRPPTFDDAPRRAPSPRPSSWRSAATAALAASALAGVLGLWYGSSRRVGPPPAPRVQASAPAATLTAAATPAPPAPSVPTPPAPAPALPVRPVGPPARPVTTRTREPLHKLQIVANEPVARVRVDEKWLPVSAPARQLDVPLGPLQSQRGFVLQAISARGRTIETRVAPGARMARLDFPNEPSELHPMPALADNPYGEPP
jgi:serine/threonine-protein kinase